MAFELFVQFVRGIQGKINSNMFGGLQGQNSQHMAFIRQLQRELKAEDTMEVPLDQLNAAVFDIETTGFFPEKGDRILSIGAIKILNGEIQDDQTFYSLVHNEKDVSQEITVLTGITSEQLLAAPLLSEVLIKFIDFIKDLPLIAHHAYHEKKFMQNVWWSTFRIPFKHRIMDTSFLYRLIEQEGISIKLEDFCERNQIPIINRHHALGDAKLTAQLWCSYSEKIQKLGCRNMKEVYERLARFR